MIATCSNEKDDFVHYDWYWSSFYFHYVSRSLKSKIQPWVWTGLSRRVPLTSMRYRNWPAYVKNSLCLFVSILGCLMELLKRQKEKKDEVRKDRYNVENEVIFLSTRSKREGSKAEGRYKYEIVLVRTCTKATKIDSKGKSSTIISDHKENEIIGSKNRAGNASQISDRAAAEGFLCAVVPPSALACLSSAIEQRS